jgi:outer membrane lipoprotein-sorting protein
VFEPIRRLHFSDVRDVQGRPFPHRWEMEPLEKPGHRTTIEIEEVRFDVPLDEGLFTRANLKRAEAVR